MKHSDAWNIDLKSSKGNTVLPKKLLKPKKKIKSVVNNKPFKTLFMHSIIPFGKYKGRSLTDILLSHPDYFKWLIGNMAGDTKSNISEQVFSEWFKCRDRMIAKGLPL